MKTVFSGIQPSGLVHLGNLLGAINNWVKLSNENSKNYFCIVDLHSLTGLPNKNDLKKSINDTLKVLVASGINTKTSVIYTQSNLQEHAYLSWILSNFCQVGELQRMTQFKEKASSFGTHSGLLTYPILMASDILIHKANEVPVGDDQTQHLELTRNIAERFNKNKDRLSKHPETKRIFARDDRKWQEGDLFLQKDLILIWQHYIHQLHHLALQIYQHLNYLKSLGH